MSFNYHTLFLRLANKDLKDLISIWMFRFFTLRENAGLVVATVVGYAYVYTPPRTGPHWQLVKALCGCVWLVGSPRKYLSSTLAGCREPSL